MQYKHIHFYITVVAVLLVTGCKVGKDYQRPEVQLPQQFNGQSFADTNSIAEITWKDFFTDPALLELINKGIAYNNDLLVAIKRIDIAQAQARQAKLLQLPEVNLQITGAINRPSDNSLNGLSASAFLGKSYIENYQVLTSISWEADIWGKIRRQKEAVLAQYLQTQEAARAVQTQVVSSIAQGYYNLLMLDRQLVIARNNLALNDTFVNVTRILRDGGVVTTLAVRQAEAQKQTTSLLIPQLEQDIALQENALQVLTGQLPGTVSRTAVLNDIPLPASMSTGLPVAMVSRRPDVRTNEMALVVANAQVGIAQANMYPALSITAGGGLESFKSSNWFNIPGSLFGLAAGTIAQPIFRKRQLKTQFEIAKLEREQAVIEFRQAVLLATGEVSNALVQVEKLKEQRVIAVNQVDTLKEAVGNAQLLFKSDMANYLEVIAAQTTALQAELNLAAIQRSQLGAVVELYRSLGGGWK
ncbi:efflux transporter outer membrane subunit [Paraflavitalea sp. CAU 1676]|uniref:efflux transporter outer membrane subunit n=1 Tax=Paraflavitalea sp. CAU 1676 TaxID=3032598 RepID=UPI0023DA0879|nr:efflux transporter outer membrane subunit [Paraflavitalea sp. CAU 1676]MDF2189893.1 efflux transporter outer membrane subunit [Paraflavitalea sp. CAU 1676]